MKFRFLLWMLGFLMGKASRNNPAFQQQLVDKDLVFQLKFAVFMGTAFKVSSIPLLLISPTLAVKDRYRYLVVETA